MHFLVARKYLVVATIISSAFVASLVISEVALAYNRTANNAAEAEARSMCNFQSRGAIWFTNNAASYYAMGVVASASATSVTVYLRGSSNTCVDSSNAGESSYAIDISASGRLSGISSGAALYRGTWPGTHANYNWTSRGNSVTATLNITGITDGQTVWVSLFRCPSFNGSTVAGNPATACYASDVPIRVTRLSPQWSINGQSYVKLNSTNNSARRQGQDAVTALPGDTLYWDHDLRNIGPDNMNRDVRIDINRRDYLLSDGSSAASSTSPSGVLRRGADGVLFYTNYNASRVVTQNDVGRKLCRRIAWNDASWNDTGWGHSSYACANVPYNYSITPYIEAVPSVAGPGATFDVRSMANNAGPTKSRDTSWTVRSFILPVGANPSALTAEQYNNSADICNNVFQVSYGATNCTIRASSPPTFQLASGTTQTVHTITGETIPAGATPGQWYCYVFSIDSYSHNSSPNRRHSAPQCTLIANRPYLSVVGGDAWAANTAPAYSFRGAGGSTFGTFGEYGVFASRNVNLFGSSGRVGVVQTTTGIAMAPLTFANTGPLLGNFAPAANHTVYNPSSRFATATSTAPSPLTGSTIASPGATITGSGLYSDTTAVGTIYIAAASLPAGRNVVLYIPNATVRITGDIQYDSTGAASFAALPSLTIIAKNIVVDGAVQRIDGFLYAAEQFVSCSEGPRTSGADPATTQITTTGACRNALVLNGALSIGSYVVGMQPVFNRSFGGTTTGLPAEVIRMRPEVFLTPYEEAYNSGATALRTVKEEELPPRY